MVAAETLPLIFLKEAMGLPKESEVSLVEWLIGDTISLRACLLPTSALQSQIIGSSGISGNGDTTALTLDVMKRWIRFDGFEIAQCFREAKHERDATGEC